ncbi:RRM_1 domain-containing protein [Cephalotus follicularis]|uniref:RRM_1 domain-containing protein n=1 Tax=Cephalotus follicularis TaxID=3775 RepID=A0A1Q3BW23_CEPFO|nr:RRM_1 domain-containing protein [Cephalotus follicularis]
MKSTLMFLARRATTTLHSPTSSWRCYCASSSPTTTLFVGGLSWSADEKSLKDAFSSFGEVAEVRIIYDKDSGRSRGFGFVSFCRGDDAVNAKDAMDGKALLGRPLRINFALGRVRGGPVVVPRLPNIGDTSGCTT